MSNTVMAAPEQFRVGAVLGQSFSILFRNIVPFGLLYLAVNATSSLYALVVTAGNRWRLFGLILCLFVAGGIVDDLVSRSTDLILAGDAEPVLAGQAAIIVSWLSTALFMAGQAVLTAVSYYHLRVAKEGVGTTSPPCSIDGGERRVNLNRKIVLLSREIV